MRFKHTIATLLSFGCSLTAHAAAPTQAYLESTAAKYSHRLHLDDWVVLVHVVRLEELQNGSAGDSYTNPMLKAIQIDVLDARDYPALDKRSGGVVRSAAAINADMVNTVVHELVHLRLRDLTRGLDKSDAEVKAEETVVVRLTAALLGQKRL